MFAFVQIVNVVYVRILKVLPNLLYNKIFTHIPIFTLYVHKF